MVDPAKNPFQSPKAVESEPATEQLLIGTTIAKGYRYVAYCCIGLALVMGLWVLRAFLAGNYDAEAQPVISTAVVFLAAAMGIAFYSLMSQDKALLSANQEGIEARFYVGGKWAATEVQWQDVVQCEIDNQATLYLDTRDGTTYAVSIACYSLSEQEQLRDFCQKRLTEKHPGGKST